MGDGALNQLMEYFEQMPESYRNLLSTIADFTPVVGDIKSVVEGVQAAREGDYLGAALGGLGALPLVPNLAGMIKGMSKKQMEELLKYGQEADDFLYHVAPAPQAKQILEKGLEPKPLGRTSTFSNPTYRTYGLGKAFLTERGGVPFWHGKVEDHLFDQFDRPPSVKVLQIPKKDIKSQLHADDIGTKDSKHPSWYVTETIPPK